MCVIPDFTKFFLAIPKDIIHNSIDHSLLFITCLQGGGPFRRKCGFLNTEGLVFRVYFHGFL